MTTVNVACLEATRRLQAVGIDSARLDARLLMGFVLGGGPERVLADRDETLSAEKAERFEALIARREKREPLAHLTGVREFWSLTFQVSPATLVPRPDSETLVEAVLENMGDGETIVDLGTGSGCLLLAVLSERPASKGVGLDASADALQVARANARALHIAADFVEGSWLDGTWRDVGGPFDVVIANPPYIPSADIEGLAQDVRAYDPMAALDGGVDGLDSYRAIVELLDDLLEVGGLVAFEVGIDQADDVAVLLANAGFEDIATACDLGGIARVVLARKKELGKQP